jgi:signal transduction histidine kinase
MASTVSRIRQSAGSTPGRATRPIPRRRMSVRWLRIRTECCGWSAAVLSASIRRPDASPPTRSIPSQRGRRGAKTRLFWLRWVDLSPVSGDRVQLQQVLLNLVMNAMDAMSSVEDRARQLVITTENIDPDRVQVTLEDSGTGLAPNTMVRIFDPFYTTKCGGMGMGLSISRSILQNHGGRLWATANNGPGTSFHFTLPKYQREESNAGAAAV